MKRIFLNDKFILFLIIFNALTIFFGAFKLEPIIHEILIYLDHFITALFIVELVIKLNEFGIKKYFKSGWNKFDFILIVLSSPTLISFILNSDITDFSYLLVFRVLRVFKSFRFLKFIPGIEDLFKGVQRALKSSIVVIFGFAIYIFIIGIFSCYLFKDIAPDYFSNPIVSFYSTFKIFTIEGWYEIPEQLSANLSKPLAFFSYLYFIFVLLSGGIFGLSLVNSIFVDAMVADNNDNLERKVDDLNKKITELINQKNNTV